MPSFDYRTPSNALDAWVARFPDWAAGRNEWELNPGDVLDVELPAPPKLARPRVFISHSLGHVFSVEPPLRSWLDGERIKFDPALIKPTSYWSKFIPPKLPP
jgi:hypothetical protein